MTIIRKQFLWLFILVLLFSACSDNAIPAEETPIMETATQTATVSEPTPTLLPAAAVVNGERVPLALFTEEITRYLLAQESLDQPIEDETVAREIVLQDLIDLVLLAQAARADGFVVEDEDVQARLDALADEVDLNAWLAEWGYTEVDLFQSLKLQMLAAYQRDQITGSVPETAEQAEIQQVFAYTETGADRALVSLNSRTPFEDVAFTYDPVAGGYLGWVPRGYLLIADVEEAAFSLPVGTYSQIIESDIGYHIVMVIAREERPLTNDARLTLQRQALHDWIAQQRENSTIEVLVD